MHQQPTTTKVPFATRIEIHPGVRQVIEFMNREVPPDQLIGVAEALPDVARAIWSQHGRREIAPLILTGNTIDPQ